MDKKYLIGGGVLAVAIAILYMRHASAVQSNAQDQAQQVSAGASPTILYQPPSGASASDPSASFGSNSGASVADVAAAVNNAVTTNSGGSTSVPDLNALINSALSSAATQYQTQQNIADSNNLADVIKTLGGGSGSITHTASGISFTTTGATTTNSGGTTTTTGGGTTTTSGGTGSGGTGSGGTNSNSVTFNNFMASFVYGGNTAYRGTGTSGATDSEAVANAIAESLNAYSSVKRTSVISSAAVTAALNDKTAITFNEAGAPGQKMNDYNIGMSAAGIGVKVADVAAALKKYGITVK